MKRFFLCCILVSALLRSNGQKEETKDSFYVLSPVELKAIRAGANSPFSKTNISKEAIEKNNLGQDLPFLLSQTPSVVINSDAGNGIGYTGIRIRGTDATRINVTLNGIPYNDAESQGTFFVDLPDFSSSTGSIQIQRGVGGSSNGTGAFGASINLSTNEINKEAYAELNNSFGSFNSWKNTLKAGTGLHNGFSTDVRLSRIGSDGFIDRASSDLKSLYFSQAYRSKKTGLRLNIFSGKEKTYQAWYGISQADLDAGNRTMNYAGTEKPGDPYKNEIDNYTQTHYQLFFDQQFSDKLHFNTALFWTRGKGYYEQYKAEDDYADYNMPYPMTGTGTVYTSDFIRQLWLDNDFYGNIFSLQYKHKKVQATLGGSYTKYEGEHYGKIIWASEGLTAIDSWYDLNALKNDLTLYLKQQTQLNEYWYLYYDLQFRNIKYNINGFRNNPAIRVNNKFNFFNPKLGITYSKNNWKAYLSYSIANKEPNRDDFEAGTSQQPKPERLYDTEAGIERTGKKYSWSIGAYYMRYKDQLVLTGKINDVGAYTRTNIPDSYRAGVELQGAVALNQQFNITGNLTLSQNKINRFEEYIDDYDNGGQLKNNYSDVTIAYSPAVIGSAIINYLPVKKLEISLQNKYVSKQHLDNTENNNRVLDAFFVQDFRVDYRINKKLPKEINIIGQVNNILNVKYEPNGYTFSYIYGGSFITENYYFPMAGINFMLGLNLKF